MEEIEITIKGKVQGTGLRRAIKKFSDENQIKGQVKNNSDGSIKIISQGGKEKINELLSFLNKNPSISNIEELNYKIKKPQKEFENFEIIKEKGFILDQVDSFINLGKHLLNKKSKPQIPKHIVIIPDGNRRWAKSQGKIPTFGHEYSSQHPHLNALFEESQKQGIPYFTIWGFSTENWNRGEEEIKFVFKIVEEFLESYEKDLFEKQTRFRHLGRKDRLPESLKNKIIELEEKTQNHKNFNIQLCLDYGGRDEILRAINKLITTQSKNITEEEFKKFLDTKEIPDPDLIIRTSGEKRLSGILPFQSTYAELYFLDKHFPEINVEDFKEAIEEFSRRKRRFGGN